MLEIPVALILSAALSLLAVNLWRKRKEYASVIPFLALALLASLQALLVSLRWDFGIRELRFVQVIVASALPGLAWLTFQAAVSGRAFADPANVLHILSPVIVGIAIFVMPDAIDIILVASFLIYGALFFQLARAGDASFDRTAFNGMFDMRLAIRLLAFMLLGSALVDILVLFDFLRVGGGHAAWLIGIGNLVWLLALGSAVALGSQSLSIQPEEPETAPSVPAMEEDHLIAAKIGNLLAETPLIKDPSLTLSRIARRAGLPVRSVSNAINRVHGCNVSQYINTLRVNRACSLLRGTDMSVTEAIYASGFQTKSNFNREFLRVTGMTPRDWRKANGLQNPAQN